jgi:hypothetical protein
LDVDLREPVVPSHSLSGRRFVVIIIHVLERIPIIILYRYELFANGEVKENGDGLFGWGMVRRLLNPVSAATGMRFGSEGSIVHIVHKSCIRGSIEMLKGLLAYATMGISFHAWDWVFFVKDDRAKEDATKRVTGSCLSSLFVIDLRRIANELDWDG